MTDRDRLILDDERRARLLAGDPPGEPTGLAPLPETWGDLGPGDKLMRQGLEDWVGIVIGSYDDDVAVKWTAAAATPPHYITHYAPHVDIPPNVALKGEPMTDRISDYRDGPQTPLTEWADRNAISNFEFAALCDVLRGSDHD